MNKTIGIDFDGVIVKCDKNDRPSEFIPYWSEAIKRLISEGYDIYIFTARNPKEVRQFLYERVTGGLDFEIIPGHYKFWNKKNKIGISNIKYPAILYIDDNAYRFAGDWNQALKEITHFI